MHVPESPLDEEEDHVLLIDLLVSLHNKLDGIII